MKITLDSLKTGEKLREIADNATKAKIYLRSLGLLTEDMEGTLSILENDYKTHCQEVVEFVYSLLPERALELFKQYNYFPRGHFFPSTILTKDNKVQVKLGAGWVSLTLLLDITDNKLYKDTFYLRCEKTELEPYTKELLEELSKVVS